MDEVKRIGILKVQLRVKLKKSNTNDCIVRCKEIWGPIEKGQGWNYKEF